MNRSKIICHMMMSLDGRIIFGKINDQEYTPNIFEQYMSLYASTEASFLYKAIMCGKTTMEWFAEGISLPLPALKKKKQITDDIIFPNEALKYLIGIDPKGTLGWKDNIAMLSGADGGKVPFSLLIVVTGQTPQEYLTYLREKKISFIFAGDKEIDFQLLLSKTKSELGMETIVLEGGGITNGSLLASGLIDEISLLLLPLIVNNSDSRALFESKVTEFKLYEYDLLNTEQRDGGVLWLHYQKSQ